jgi:hypothetical protein
MSTFDINLDFGSLFIGHSGGMGEDVLFVLVGLRLPSLVAPSADCIKICFICSGTVYIIKAWRIRQFRWGTTRKNCFKNLFPTKASNLHLETFVGSGFSKNDDVAMPRRKWVRSWPHQAWDEHHIWRSHTNVTDYVNSTRTYEAYLTTSRPGRFISNLELPNMNLVPRGSLWPEYS